MSERKPKLRFKGFTDDWEQRKFHNVFDGLQNNTLSRAELNYDGGEIQNVHYGDVLVKFGDYVDVSTEQLPYISNTALANKFSNSYLQNGDVVIADTAEDETVGKCTEIVGAEGKKLISGLHTIPCRPKRAFASKFLGYYMNSNAYHAQLIPLMQGIKVTSISKGVLQDTDMILPASFDEQKQIGSYFSNLDNLITLHERKVKKLKNIKKSMLIKMFPANGQKKPEIRFAGYTDDWEQRKFSDIAEIRRGLTYKPTDISKEGVRVLRSSNINEELFEVHEDDVFVNANAVNIPYTKNGDILITSANGSNRLVGKHTVVRGIEVDSTVHGGFMLIASSDEPEFVNASMSSAWYTNFIKVFVAGGNGAIGNLNKKDLDEQDVLVPYREERDRIGSFFSNIDNLITLHERKVKKLKKIKLSMLNNMFV
ncbi:restriction endonuclease subunit S [Selenomonas ruminis]|uniref:Restriction endonuclease subunit S n=1 Tax=Selenomonas ruminis TaxID=2593411 RepID=A0A5D6W2R7_9FIRM|nr:restriction endonuclease subunit S [Selenomonas sp. mPRGC5]TYZ21702.1 restriction endonuclease subunit S [Selenomonas sp. mPRGC5]